MVENVFKHDRGSCMLYLSKRKLLKKLDNALLV